MTKHIKIAVLLSGSGTNLQRIIDDIENNTLKNCEICVVVSNKITAYGLMRAKKQKLITTYFPFLKEKEERRAGLEPYSIDRECSQGRFEFIMNK